MKKKENNTVLIVEYLTQHNDNVFKHHEELNCKTDVIKLFNSLGIYNVYSGKKIVLEDKAEVIYPSLVTVDSKEMCVGETNFKIPVHRKK